MKKKLLLLLIALAGLLPVRVAARDFTYTYEGQTITYTVINETTKTVKTKAGTYDNSTGENPKAGNNVEGDLVIPETVYDNGVKYSVTEIGDFSFVLCIGLTSVSLPNSITKIGEEAFVGCDNLTKADFASIESFCSIDFNPQYGNPLTVTHKLYINNEEIKELVIPNTVKSIKPHAFDGCYGLTSIEIPNSVTEIGDCAFYGCYGLTSITIPNSVTSIGIGAFYLCMGLTSIEIPNSVTEIAPTTFGSCVDLTSIIIPNSVRIIGDNAFERCSELMSIDIPNSVTTIGESAFADCKALTSVTIPNSVIKIGRSAFNNCIGLKKAEFESVEALCKTAFIGTFANPLYYAHNLYINGTEVKDLVIPNTVTFINSDAFSGCSGLTSVTIGNSVTFISSEAFRDCSGLTSIEIPNSVTKIGDLAFYGCSGLTSVYYGTEEPISGYQSIFRSDNDIIYTNATLYVPEAAIEKCKEIEPWKNFAKIEAYDFANTDEVLAESVKLDKEADELKVGETTTLTTTVLPENTTDKTVTWSSSDESVATVDQNGLVTALKVGTTTITAKTANGKEASCEITVTAKVIELNLTQKDMVVNGNVQLTANISGGSADKTVIWTSSDESVATVDDNGYVTALSVGTATITATIEGTGVSASCSVMVKEDSGDIPFGQTFEYTYEGQTLNYNVLYDPSRLVSVVGSSNGQGIEGDLIIPEKVSYNDIEYTITKIGNYAFSDCSGLTSVTIGNSVTSIGDYAFSRSSGLTSIEIPNSVTSIGSSAFAYCSGLTSIEIPNSVTSIGSSAFAYCSGLTSIEIPNSVTSIDDAAFENCSGLTSIEIPNSVTSIGNEAFYYSGLTSIEIPNSVTSIGYGTFQYCSSLTSVVIPNSVTSIGNRAFSGCSGLTSIEIPNSVNLIGSSAFSDCSGLTSIEIPNSVTLIGDGAFHNCALLSSVVIPNSVTSIGNDAFQNCISLKSIILPTSVKYVGSSAFSFNYNLKTIIICNPDAELGEGMFYKDYSYGQLIVVCPEGLDYEFPENTKIVRFKPEGASVLDDGTLLTNYGKTLTFVPYTESVNYVIPEGVEVIGSDAFSAIYSLESLTIPGSLKEIEADAFRNTSIEKVYFTNWPTWYTDVTLGNFYSNPYWNGKPYVGGVVMTTPELKEGMTEIPDYKNYNLYFKDEVDLPTTIKRIGSYAFYNNKELYSVILPSGLEEIGESAFEGCELLENPSFPAGLKKIEDGAYKDCTKISEITLPSGLTYLGEMTPESEMVVEYQDHKGVFQGCTALEKAVLVADIDYLDDNLFRNCSSLQTVFLPLELKTIGSYVFYNTGLDEITFPATLESIGEYSFASPNNYMNSGRQGISTLVIPNSVTSIGKGIFSYQRISNLTIGSGLKSIPQGAFQNNRLEIINFSEGLEEIGSGAFADNNATISTINLPSTVKSIGEYAFLNTPICEMSVPDGVMTLLPGSCGSPSVLTIGSGVKEIAANAFSFNKLYTIRLKAHTPPTLTDAFPISEAENDQLTLIVNQGRHDYYSTNARWKQIDNIIEEGQSEVVIYMTGDYAISEEIRVTSGLMPSQVTKMKVVGPLTANDLRIIKENMPALTSLDLSEVKGVTAIPESQFYGSLLTDIVLPSNLESIGYGAFANCGLLQIGELPNSVKTIGQSAFYGSLRIDISKLPEALESIGTDAFNGTGIRKVIANEALNELGQGAFSNCDQLEVADFSASSIAYVPDNAFSGCYELDEVILPETVKEIGSNAFSGTALRNIDFATTVSTIGSGAFSSNRRLVAASLPKGLKVVGTNLFSDCPRLIAVSMPSTTTAVGSQIMTGDRKLSNISCAATEAPEAESGAFDGLRMRYVSLIVPTLSYRAYLNAPVWGKFQTIKNLIPVEIEEGVEASIVSEDEYQQMLEEDALEAAEEAAAEEKSNYPVPMAARRAMARAKTPQYFASLFNGAQVQTGDDDSGMRVFINPEENVTVTSILFNDEELLPEYTKNNSILLPKGAKGKLRILTSAETVEPSIDLDQTKIRLGEDQTVQLTATVTGGAADQSITWTSSDENIATVDQNGLVTGVHTGIATITAKSSNGLEATCEVTVVAKVIDADGIELDVAAKTIKEEETVQLTATVTPADATDQTVTWTSSDETVATVDQNGLVTALKAGTATITAETANGKTATCQITVVAKVIDANGISLDVTQKELTVGDGLSLTATITPADVTDKTVIWSSSDASIASVDENGNVTALKVGKATITAKTANGKEATCEVTVVAKVIDAEGIELNMPSAEVVEGDAVELTATITPADVTDKTVTWSSSDTSVASVDANGIVTALRVGKATITAKTANGKTATCQITVVAKVIDADGIELNMPSAEVVEGDAVELTATITPADVTDKTVTWSSSDASVASVDANGIVTALKVGKATITAKTANGLEATCEVTVVAKVIDADGIELNMPAAEVVEGDAVELTATITPSDVTDKTVTWSSSNTEVATVDQNGTVTALKVGKATITAKTANGKEATCVITVVAKVIEAEGIELNMPSAEVVEGDVVELTATITPANVTDKTVIWSSSDASVASVDANGIVTALKVGKATITAKTANGLEATCEVTVVAKVIDAEGISLDVTAETIKEEETLQLTATVTPADATDQTVTWSSSDETVATVDQNGLVKALKAGTATITAETANGLKATCVVTVETKTGVDGVEADAQISAVAREGVIIVTAPEGMEVEVYSMTGMRVAKTREHRVEGLSRGVYIVSVGGKAFKVIV